MQIELPSIPVNANRYNPVVGPGARNKPPTFTPSMQDAAYRANVFSYDMSRVVPPHLRRAGSQHQADLAQIDADIDQKIKREGGQNSPMDINTPSSTLQREKNIVVKLYYTEEQSSRAQLDHAGRLYGGNSLTDQMRDVFNYLLKPALASFRMRGHLLANWAQAHSAALRSQIHAETARRLREKESQLNTIIAAQARLMAEAAARAHAQAVAEAETRRLAAEAAERERQSAEAEAKRVAEAVDQARREAEAERIAEQQAREAAANGDTQRAGTLTITQPTVITASGSIALGATATATLQAAIRGAIAAIGGAVASVASGFAVGVSALVYSSKLGNGELPEGYAFSTPLSDFIPRQALDQHLNAIAAGSDSIDMPHRLGSTPSEDGQQEIILARTDGAIVPSVVKVYAATYDTEQNAYTVTTEDVPPRTLVWTPIATPNNTSTISPAESPITPIYVGATVIPSTGQLERYPNVGLTGFRDLITVFPADSGIAPIYTMFSNPYEGATVKGVHSGRMYNPENAGGPTENLSWENAIITQAGIDLVKLHTGRFGQSADNDVMIDRLSKILTGEIESTDTDKRFYTHEIRELERYRILGVADGEQGNVWNDAHAATLEDFKVKDDPDLLYTPEATDAYYKQKYGK